VTFPVSVAFAATVILKLADCPGETVRVAGSAVSVKSGAAAVTVIAIAGDVFE
jgi:hypothetical protein